MSSWHVAAGGPGDPKGRRVLADHPFSPGDVVLCDTPYVSVIYDHELSNRCDCCLEPGADLLRCSGCRLAYYKSREHQRRAWTAGHREECAALRQLAPRAPPPTVRLAARAVLRHCRAAQAPRKDKAAGGGGSGDGAAQGAGGGDRFGEVLSLQHHWEATPDNLKIQYAQMAALAWQLVQLANPEAAQQTTPRELALLISRFACNNHSICDDELRTVGVGVYPLVSLVNHSCTPNCMQSFSGDTLVLRAIHPISPGEEVTISYVELGALRWERRDNLLTQYYFDIDHEVFPGEGQQPQPQGDADRAADLESGQQGGQAQAAAAGAVQGPPAQAPVPDQVLQLRQGVQLCVYHRAAPPWPHDPRDFELSAVYWAGQGAAQQPAGGVWGEAAPASAGEAGGEPGATSSADAAESFPWEGEDGMGPSQPQAQAAARDGRAAGIDSSSGGVGRPAPAGSGRITVHCWLTAEPAAQRGMQGTAGREGGGCGSGGLGGEAAEAAAQLAGGYAQALRQLQQAERLLGAGAQTPASAAMGAATLLQQALAALPPASDAGAGGYRLSVPSRRLGLGACHVLRMRLLAAAVRAAVAAGGMWEQALAWMRELLPIYKRAYPQFWPNLGLHWASIAKLEHFLGGRAQQAQHAAQRALAILSCTDAGGGGGSSSGGGVLGELQKVLFEARQELQEQGGTVGG